MSLTSKAATGGDLTAATARTFTFPTAAVKTAKVQVLSTAAAGIKVKWNATDVAADEWDTYLAPGDEAYSPPFVRIGQLSLISTSNLTYNTDFNVRGFTEIS